ncbi:MAG: hypothetical protein KTV68_00035 [Acidimicrobiia bacterium]|nr:hypothetical protein [Acidimicrobiia bacterium]MCY4433046.1 hypothetical protein [bacterium]
MCALAHVLEEAGIATVVLASMRAVAERMNVPRVLHCEFPLGRPLGMPDNAEFQHGVLSAAFELLDASSGPVLVDYPEVVEAVETPLACALPPRFDPDIAPSIDEAQGLRAAYERAVARRGATEVGRAIDADGVAGALADLERVAAGEHWKEVYGPRLDTIAIAHDIRAYYQEAALELAGGPPPGARQAEAWFYEETEAGKTLAAARDALTEQEAPSGITFYMQPVGR